MAVPDFENWRKREYPWLVPIGDGVQVAREAWSAALAATPSADVPTGYVRADQAYSVLQLHEDLRDVWCEANAVDTVIGRPDALMKKLTRIRDAVANAANGYLPIAPAAAAPVVLPEPVAWRHSRTYDLHDTEDEVQLADGDEHAQPLFTEQQVRALLAGVSAPATQAVEPVEYPYLPAAVGDVVDFHDGRGLDINWADPAPAVGTSLYSTAQMRAYVDADRAARTEHSAPQVQADAREAQLLAFAVSEIRRDEMGHAPVLYVSKGQLDNHRDPDGPDSTAHGRYLPARVTPAGKFTAPLFAAPQAQADARDAVLAHLDGLMDDAAAHIYPSDLNKFQSGEHTATVASVRMGNSSERSVPLYSREQVVEAFNATRAAQGEKHEG